MRFPHASIEAGRRDVVRCRHNLGREAILVKWSTLFYIIAAICFIIAMLPRLQARWAANVSFLAAGLLAWMLATIVTGAIPGTDT